MATPILSPEVITEIAALSHNEFNQVLTGVKKDHWSETSTYAKNFTEQYVTFALFYLLEHLKESYHLVPNEKESFEKYFQTVPEETT